MRLDGTLNRLRFSLPRGPFPNTAVQTDCRQHGADAFVFEVVEVVKVKDDPDFDPSDELSLLEELWIEEVRRLDAPRANTSDKIRLV